MADSTDGLTPQEHRFFDTISRVMPVWLTKQERKRLGIDDVLLKAFRLGLSGAGRVESCDSSTWKHKPDHFSRHSVRNRLRETRLTRVDQVLLKKCPGS